MEPRRDNVVPIPSFANSFKERLYRAVDALGCNTEEELLLVTVGIIEVGINGNGFNPHLVKDVITKICDEKINRDINGDG